MAETQHTHIETELSRDLGLISALAIGVGTMIAAGIFSLSGLAIKAVGSAAIVSFLIAAFVALFTALTYCEFVSIYPNSGEGYLYARKTFSAPLAFLVGWALFLGYAASCGFYLATFSSYFIEFVYHLPYRINRRNRRFDFADFAQCQRNKRKRGISGRRDDYKSYSVDLAGHRRFQQY